MDGTILSQGSFIQPATAVNQAIIIPSNVDWLDVYNWTQAGATNGNGYWFYWQRPNGAVIMGDGTQGIVQISGAAHAVTVNQTASGAFTLYDPSGQSANAQPLLGPLVATTATTNATRPVVSTANTTGVVVGSVVRLQSTAQTDINGQDFVVGAVVANTSITLLTASNALANAPGAIGGAGFYQVVNYNSLFYPRKRLITNITQAANAQVSTAIAHGLTVGQEVRFNIPAVSGMIQLNPDPSNNYFPTGASTNAIILSVVDDYNFTININSTGYTAFTYPTIAQQPSSFPLVIPFGEDTATALSSTASQTPTIGGVQIYNTNTGILADSTVNTGYLGMILSAGALLPGGSANDVIFWRAGKSTLGGL